MIRRNTKPLAWAVLAGPAFWLAWWAWQRPALHLDWPLQEPGRFLLAGLVYPVLEEIVFRGGVQGYFLRFPGCRRAWHGLTLANLMTSLAFSTLHLLAHSPPWAAAVFLPSLVFGWLRDRTGGLGCSIGLHVWYNVGYFWLFG